MDERIYGLISGFPLASVNAFANMKPTFFVNSETFISYCAVDPLKDNKYVQKLDNIFFESGIIEIAANQLSII